MKAAVIGCGRMGAEPATRLTHSMPIGWLPISHLESLQAIQNIELIALCDTNEKLLEERAKYYHIQKDLLFSDYKNMIDTLNPDIITIATRTPVKSEIIQYACAHGVKGIYVEKPISNSIESSQEILKCISSANVKIAYGVNRRYHSTYRYARELISNGIIGTIQEVCVEHGQSQLLWTHPHSVDLLLFFANQEDIEQIQAFCIPHSVNRISNLTIDSDPIIENAFFKFASGVTGQILRSNGLNVKISGTDGNIIIHGNGSLIQLNKKTNTQPDYCLDHKILTPPSQTSATITALEELIASIRDDTPPPISHNIIEQGMKMLLGCVWSHLNEGKRIDVSSIPLELFVSGKYNNLYA